MIIFFVQRVSFDARTINYMAVCFDNVKSRRRAGVKEGFLASSSSAFCCCSSCFRVSLPPNLRPAPRFAALRLEMRSLAVASPLPPAAYRRRPRTSASGRFGSSPHSLPRPPQPPSVGGTDIWPRGFAITLRVDAAILGRDHGSDAAAGSIALARRVLMGGSANSGRPGCNSRGLQLVGMWQMGAEMLVIFFFLMVHGHLTLEMVDGIMSFSVLTELFNI